MHQSKEKTGTIALKVNLEKAYDNVYWDFLETTLVDFGFLEISVHLIMSYIHSSSLSILWNGAKLDLFPLQGV